MADISRRKKEDTLRLKAKLEAHRPLVDRGQAILLWLDLSGQVTFVLLCIILHFAIAIVASIAEVVTLPALLLYGTAFYLLAKYGLTTVNIPWLTILSLGAGPSAAPRPYTVDEIVQLVVSAQYSFYLVQVELEKLRDINYTKYTLQVSSILLSLGFVANYFSGYTMAYLAVYGALLFPGAYTHRVFSKLWQLLNSQPHIAKAIQTVDGLFQSVVGSIAQRPAVPVTIPTVTTVHAASVNPSSSGTVPTVKVTTATPVVPAVVVKRDDHDVDTEDFVKIPSDKKDD